MIGKPVEKVPERVESGIDERAIQPGLTASLTRKIEADETSVVPRSSIRHDDEIAWTAIRVGPQKEPLRPVWIEYGRFRRGSPRRPRSRDAQPNN